MKILVLGATGMIGSSILDVLSEQTDWEVYGTVRSSVANLNLPKRFSSRLISASDFESQDSLINILEVMRPNVIINCVGITKHKLCSNDSLKAIAINSAMPHRLALIGKLINARVIHISTDCVFSGLKGSYKECDFTDADDVYGRSKALGEVTNEGHVITLRTSTIGYELAGKHGLLEWFLSQKNFCKGFSQAFFSGIPTVVLSEIIRDVIIPSPSIFGLFNIASKPINKYELLSLIAQRYCKKIDIIDCPDVVIDRSLDGSLFDSIAGYEFEDWPTLIEKMKVRKRINYV